MIIIIWNLDGTWSSIWGLVRPFRDFGLYWFGLYRELAVNISTQKNNVLLLPHSIMPRVSEVVSDILISATGLGRPLHPPGGGPGAG